MAVAATPPPLNNSTVMPGAFGSPASCTPSWLVSKNTVPLSDEGPIKPASMPVMFSPGVWAHVPKLVTVPVPALKEPPESTVSPVGATTSMLYVLPAAMLGTRLLKL